MRRFARRTALLVVAPAITLVAAAWLTARPGDPALYPPAPGDEAVEEAVEEAVIVRLVARAWHSGLLLPRDDLSRAAGKIGSGTLLEVTERFGAYPALEIGWGDAGFYRAVPTIDALDWRLALKALFTPGGRPAVLHVVGVAAEPGTAFPGAEIMTLPLSRAGFRRLATALGHAFTLRDGHPVEAGPGLYGPSLFYEAEGRFSLLNVCNHWSAGLLNEAGLPVTPLLDTLPQGLALDLAWRAPARAR
ncbi:DUF2459 domain-containing protein [Methylobacterium frigidaeris]|uniref:DUF2459 domain-containing protein n=1 Tax=Methylobacterium frigidaeris TaxID=2038277 RepID=A0AA37M5D9_9HYPH|nr:DUF2459 domain-containing protein [Methylobacterium frigidaeris]PIK74251.1 hypothetical protein CS379_03560 [Methylobacterium frigidaeris]GJD63518.1 hypothetical protein MPEAHAMD_3688 [Methylobacterium frigidaeris]